MTFNTKSLFTTKDGWIVTADMLKQIKKELPMLSTEETLRIVDLFKSGVIHTDIKNNNVW